MQSGREPRAGSRESKRTPPALDPRRSTLDLIYALAYGLFLGLAILKFGNPVILDEKIFTPTSFSDAWHNAWPTHWSNWILLTVALAGGALALTGRWRWPGNVRELENLIERALALCEGGVIRPSDLHLLPGGGQPSEVAMQSASEAGGKFPLPDYLDRVERKTILEALHQTGFNRTAAAKLLGITFRALRYRMERLNITDKEEA